MRLEQPPPAPPNLDRLSTDVEESKHNTQQGDELKKLNPENCESENDSDLLLAERAISITLRMPNGSTKRIPLIQASETVNNLKQLILDIPEFCHISCCHLEVVPPNQQIIKKQTKRGIVSTNTVVLDEGRILHDYDELKEGYHVVLVKDNYNLQAVIDHVRRLRFILENPPAPFLDEDFGRNLQSGKSNHSAQSDRTSDKTTRESPEAKDINDEVNSMEQPHSRSRMKQDGRSLSEISSRLKDEEVPLNVKLSSFHPGEDQRNDGIEVNLASGMIRGPNQLKSWREDCLSKLQFSGWNPPYSRRMLGDLAYLEVSTSSEPDVVLHITAFYRGFFINSTRNDKFNPNPSHNSCESETLVELLQKASSAFKKTYASLLSKSAEIAKRLLIDTALNEFDLVTLGYTCKPSSALNEQGIVTNMWNGPIPRKEDYRYDINRSYDRVYDSFGVERSIARDWNEEYQSCVEMPSETLRERVLRCRNLDRIQKEFVESATKASNAIIEGRIPPLNPADPKYAHVYVYNQIFFSKAKPESILPPDEFKKAKAPKGYPIDANRRSNQVDGPAIASYSVSNHDLLGVKCLNESWEVSLTKAKSNKVGESGVQGESKLSLKTLMTVVIDHFGHRIIAQSIIPGILQSDHDKLLVYGSVDYGKTIVKDREIEERWRNISKSWGIGPSIVRTADGPVEIYGPVESKSIKGSDGRVYALDLLRITPYDLNYYEKRKGYYDYSGELRIPVDSSNSYVALVRPELIRMFCTGKT